MLRRALLAFSALLAVLIAVSAGGLFWITKRAEPAYSGETEVAGIAAPVEIRYGPHGVPSIRAESLPDLLFAQGYVVAGERMWQIDLMRRLAQGRLAEVFGAGALGADRLMRTLGLREAARRALETLSDEERALLAAFATGVNAYRERAETRLPLEYRIAGFAPAPWQPEDSLAIGAYMAWTQSFQAKHELTFLRLAGRLGPERARELFPTDAGVPAPPVPPELAAALGGDHPESASAAFQGLLRSASDLLALQDLPARFGLPVPGPASNAWAVTGRRTAGGEALLANDPHLAPSVPGIWYELELECPDLHAAGLTLPGVPLVLIGHNADLAWGFTSAIADTQDLFLERPTPDGQAVERAGAAPEPIVTRVERIPVKGADPAELSIRSTGNGVLLNDLLHERMPDPGGNPLALPPVDSPYLLALRQNHDLPDRSFPALLALNRAHTLAEARAAILGFRHVAVNLLVAHRSGGIAWQVSGLLPQRGKGNGAFPSPGWAAGYGWDGFYPQGLNPSRSQPSSATLINANNRSVPLDYPVSVSRTWMAPFRAERIAERIEASNPLTPAEMESIQGDRLSIEARLAQSAVRRLEPELRAGDPEAWAIAETGLLEWDGIMDGSSPQAALFALIEPALYRALYGDELGEDLPALMALAGIAYNPIQEVIRSGRSSFWDDVGTPETEGPAQVWARALRTARDSLAERLPDPEERRLERLRTLTFPHAFHNLPWLGRLFDLGPIGVGGGADTVNVSKTSALEPGQVLFVPSARLVQVPSDWSQTRGTLPLGQSGHRLSRYRSDQLADWLAGRTHPWPWNGPAAGLERGVAVLKPMKPADGR